MGLDLFCVVRLLPLNRLLGAACLFLAPKGDAHEAAQAHGADQLVAAASAPLGWGRYLIAVLEGAIWVAHGLRRVSPKLSFSCTVRVGLWACLIKLSIPASLG